MAFEIIMPKAGMAMEEGKIIRWLKEVGDPIEAGEGVMEIETDKINMENEASHSGVLLAKCYEDGDTVPVTTIIGYIGKPGEAVPDAPAAGAPVGANYVRPPAPTPNAPPIGTETPVGAHIVRPPVSDAPTAVVDGAPGASRPTRDFARGVDGRPNATPTTQQQAGGGQTLATPYARTLAAEAGLDLTTLTGSGKDGVIKARDISRATPLAARMAADQGIDLSKISGSGFGGKITKADLSLAQAGADIVKPLAGMRAVIAKRMTQSHDEIPTVTQTMKAYVDELLTLRAKANQGRTDKITINDFILKATAKAMAGSDLFRTEIDMANSQLITRARTNIAVAVALDEGLMVPVILDADKLTLTEISAAAKDLSSRARSGQLLPNELTGSVITVSNLGASGIFTFTPIINQPNASILGIGSIHEELAMVDGAVVTRKFVMLCLTYDHRIIDGAQATAFQGQIRDLLENPVDILI